MRKSLLLSIGLSLGLALAQFSMALAHAVLLLAAPTPNGFYPSDDPPTRVKITFSEEVAPAFSAIRAFTSSGAAVDNGDTHALNLEKTILAVSLKPLDPGIYTVAWEVLSAVDGHPSSGSYTFGVGVTVPNVATIGQTTSAAPGSTLASVGARWLTLTGQVLLLGVFAFRFFVWPPALKRAVDEDAQLDLAMTRWAIRVGWIGLGLVGLGLLLILVSQREAIRISISPELIANFRAWLGTRFGGMWVIRLWLSLGLIFNLADMSLGLKKEDGLALRRLTWDWWAGLGMSLALGLTSTFTSHSAALQAGQPWAVMSDGAHMLAAGVWVGGLVQLVIATRLTRNLSGEARVKHTLNLILNFSTLAAIAVGALLVSGVYLAWQHIGTWAALFKTTYGLTLLVKLGLALTALMIASVNLLVIKPRFAAATNALDSNHSLIQRRFNRLVLIEATLALVVVATAGLLTDLQRGRDALVLAEQSRTTVSQVADDLLVTLTIEPALWAQASAFDVNLLDSGGKPLLNAREVSLRFKFLDRSLGTNKVTAEPVGNGHYRAQGTYLSLSGIWEVEVAVRRPDAFDAFGTFQFETATDGVTRPVSTSPTLAERLTAFLTRSRGWLTGSVLILFAFAWVIPAVQASRGKIGVALGLLLLPSLIAMWAGVLQIVEAMNGPIPPSDPQALALLAESDAAMNRLTSVQVLTTTRGDSGLGVTETVAFQAPNLFYDQVSNGSVNMARGATYYYREPGEGLWQAVRWSVPFTFPNFVTGHAVSARLGEIEEVNGRQAQIVTYTLSILRKPVKFTRWIDLETKLILQEYMDAPGHHMLSNYHDFNAPATITVPAPSEIGPTPTVITP